MCLILTPVAGASRTSNCQQGLQPTEMHPSALRRLLPWTTPERRLKTQALGVVFLGVDGLVPLWSVSAPPEDGGLKETYCPAAGTCHDSGRCPPPAEFVLWDSQTPQGSLVYMCLGKPL